MTTQINSQTDAWTNIRNIHRRYSSFYEDFGGLSLVGLFVALGLIWFAADRFGYATNVYTEALSVIVTIAYLDRRAERRATKALQEQLIRQVGGRGNDTALTALDHMRDEGWLHLLDQADLRGANLANVDLSSINMGQRIDLSPQDLSQANLSNATLIYVDFHDMYSDSMNLNDSDIRSSNFEGAQLEDFTMARCDASGCNFKNAELLRANLRNTFFHGADFRHTVLIDSDLTGAQFGEYIYYWDEPDGDSVTSRPARFDETTILPDKSFYDPAKGLEQLERFTDAEHPDYWRSSFERSPAFRGGS